MSCCKSNAVPQALATAATLAGSALVLGAALWLKSSSSSAGCSGCACSLDGSRGVSNTSDNFSDDTMASDGLNATCALVGEGVTGTISFSQANAEAETVIGIEIQGLSPGEHGFHIHQYGDLSNGCKGAAGHFNPFGKTHGGPTDEARHVGDLGNITVGEDGTVSTTITDGLVTLYGEHTVVGRSIVVHVGTDDLGKGGHDDSLTTGHAGARACCGVIGLCA